MSVTDKVVGKGAAALLTLGGVRKLFAGVVSASALGLLKDTCISVRFTKEIPYIVNRRGDGACPVETRCMECKTPKECFVQIRSFIAEINTK